MGFGWLVELGFGGFLVGFVLGFLFCFLLMTHAVFSC